LSGCDEIRPRLAAFLHGEVEDAGEIEAHIRSCPECGRLLENHKKVARLSELDIGPSPGPDAWDRVEARMSSFSGVRLFALVPAAAAAAVALVVYVFFFSHETGRQPVGSLARQIGLVRIKPFVGGDWLQPAENEELHEGYTLQTDSDAAARVELAGGGHVLLDRNTQLQLCRADAARQEKVLHVVLVSGRTCVSSSRGVCMEAAGARIEGCGFNCFASIEPKRFTIHVESGNMCCHLGEKKLDLEPTSTLALNTETGLLERIDDPDLFKWAKELLVRTGSGED
jgi:hypothetical protein